jgi:hypothetical protein
MSHAASAEVLNALPTDEMTGLRVIDRFVYLLLAERRTDEEHQARPSMARMAKEAGVSVRHVRDAIARLEERGLIRRHSRFSGEHGQVSNSYTMRGVDYGEPTPRKARSAPVGILEPTPTEQESRPPGNTASGHRTVSEPKEEPKEEPTPLPPTQSAAVAMLGCETIPIWTYYSGEKRLTPNQARQLSSLETRAAERGLDPQAVVREAADAATSTDGSSNRWRYFYSTAERIIRGELAPKKPTALSGYKASRSDAERMAQLKAEFAEAARAGGYMTV